MPLSNQPLVIAGRTFRSRLILGTGKFSAPEALRDALEASGAEMVTVALRRADLSGKKDPFANILEFIDPKRFLLLPNTSGAMNAEEAVRLARLAVAAGLPKWVKLEIHPDPRYLLPDPVETLKAAEMLVKEGFTVLPYINADPVLAKRLQDIGTATVMPLGSPIGSNRGIQTRDQIRIIIEQAVVPVVVDAGLGAPSHASEAMEMGADAVLVNTAIAVASDPNRMATRLPDGSRSRPRRLRIRAGRATGYRQPDQPLDGFPGLSRPMGAKRNWIMPLLAALLVACVGWWADREAQRRHGRGADRRPADDARSRCHGPRNMDDQPEAHRRDAGRGAAPEKPRRRADEQRRSGGPRTNRLSRDLARQLIVGDRLQARLSSLGYTVAQLVNTNFRGGAGFRARAQPHGHAGGGRAAATVRRAVRVRRTDHHHPLQDASSGAPRLAAGWPRPGTPARASTAGAGTTVRRRSGNQCRRRSALPDRHASGRAAERHQRGDAWRAGADHQPGRGIHAHPLGRAFG